MSSTSNYNAITNLVETIIDYLIVDTAEINTATIQNLTSNVGTITTLNSTTATLTSANIPTLTTTTANITTENTTTANITTANITTENTTTANITTANITTENTTTANITNLNTNNIQPNPVSSVVSLYTTGTGLLTLGNTSNTNALTINQNTTIGTGKKISTPDILVSSLTASKIVLTDASKNIISSSYTDSDFSRLTANNTFSGSNTFSGTSNTFNNTILVNTITGTVVGSAISLFGTSTSLIDLGNSSSTSVIRLNQNTSLTAGKILRTPYLYPTSTVADLYVGNQATDSGILYIELNTDLHSSRKLKLNNTTASKLVLTNASKEIISSAYDETTLPVSTPTQTALNLKANIDAPIFTTSIGLTSGDITISSGKLVNNTFQGTTAGSSISLFSTTTAGITLGGASSGIILADNTSLSTAKNLSISASGKIISNTIEGVSVSTTGSVFTNLTVGDLNVGTGLTTGDVFLHNSTYTAGGNIYCNRDTYIDASRLLVCNTINSYSATDLQIAKDMTSNNVIIGNSFTSARVFVGTSVNPAHTGYLQIGMKFRQTRYFAIPGNISSYWNVALGSANNIFQSSILSTYAMPPISAATAPSSAYWSVWESDAQGEGSFIAQNGDTTVFCNPADNYALHWQDEDFMTVATGFKFDASGAMTITSDARAKTNINPYNKNNVLNKLNKIDMIKYTKKRPDGITRKSADDKYSKVHIGYTAQQLIEIGLDEFVEQPTTPDGYMSVCYGDIQFLFNAGVQELIKENRQRTQENKDMKVIIDDLTARLARLEQILLNPL